MDTKNVAEVARDMYEYENTREELYLAFMDGARFLHARMCAVIAEASLSEDGACDPGLLDWIRADLAFALAEAPRWITGPHKPPRTRETLAVEQQRIEQHTERRNHLAHAHQHANVLSDKSAKDKAYATFGEGWNPSRWDTLWKMFEEGAIPPETPPETRRHMEGTFFGGISSAFYDIAKAYTLACERKDAEIFRLYLRDFRRSLERRMQPVNPASMH